jgi:hypothetical protein
MKHTLIAAVLGAGVAAGTLGGCASRKEIVEGEVYPAAAARGPTLNIQVFRRQTRVELTNTTAREFGRSRLWLNAWYSREIPSLAVGQTLVLPLSEFRDRYGDAFRGGGFFATERAERLALAEIQEGPEMLAMVVVGGEEQ